MKLILGDIDREIIVSSLAKHVDIHAALELAQNFPPTEGDVVAVKVESAAGYAIGGGLLTSSLVEDRDGVWRVLAEGAIVVTVLGNRESTFWNVADLQSASGPKMQLVSNAGLCSYIKSAPNGGSINVHLLGVLVGANGRPLNTKTYCANFELSGESAKRAVSVFVGTSAEVGKTTTLLHVLREIREREPSASILAIKMSGTPSDAEINLYRSYGASRVLNLVDLGFPTSYTSDTDVLIGRIRALLRSRDIKQPDHVLIELGGDVVGGTNELILDLILEEAEPQLFLAAFDCFGASGCIRYLEERSFEVAAIVGKCVANPVVKGRTLAICGLPALSALDKDDLRQLLEMHYKGHAKTAAKARDIVSTRARVSA